MLSSHITNLIKVLLLVGLLCFLAVDKMMAQGTSPTVVRGTLKDAQTQEPLIGVSVYFPDTQIGTVTDIQGKYNLRANQPFTQVRFSYVGYKTITRTINPNQIQELNLNLEDDSQQLTEVVIKGKRRYRNKNNPAVDIIREVIAHKNSNQLQQYNFAEYEQYEKLRFSLTNTPAKLKKNFLLRKFPYLIADLDTTTLKGKALLPFYIQEVFSNNFYRRNPDKKKKIITAEKKVDFGEYIDSKGMQAYFNHLYQDIDIYQNNITVVTNQFLSPIADAAPTFYRFYITDTVATQNGKLIQLTFEPRNETDFLFEGHLYITQDGNFAVQKADLGISKTINLNWVRDLRIKLDFTPDEAGKYHLSKSEMRADLGLTPKGNFGMYGSRLVAYRNYAFDKPQPPAIYEGLPVVTAELTSQPDENFLNANRPDSLTASEAATYTNIETLRNSPSFKRTADWATLLIAGYKKAGPKIEIGPVATFYSFNPVEGFRLRFGGRTTPNFSKKINFDTYAAYGFKDEKWKYYLGATYSLTDKTIYEFPVRSVRVSYQQDTKIPGQELQLIQESNVFLSFKRGINDKYLYNKTFTLEYLQEFENHFSYRLGLKRWQQAPAGSLEFARITTTENQSPMLSNLTTAELSAELRWAPNEKFFQGKIYRTSFVGRYPVFTLRGIAGVKGLFDGEYNYQQITLNIFKRFSLSQLGYTDVVTEGGYLFGQVPYPLLSIHRANQTYSYQFQSYNLMNFLEFASDRYANIMLDHCFNGFIFNKIPLIKKTKFREYVTLKALYGGLRPENTPSENSQLLKFPTDANGQTTTYSLAAKPYVEGSVGIGNIFKFFRVDLVKRFSYLDHPNTSELGLRGQFKFDF
ncbi:carboxypeptidase-like regulatory domain-containing protein [Adhaeribacter swui]|uniref:Carboxypeptidase-like regulatory domain-containing protein n=1 Tax=Adhaeribacter swui TaxID=2086471 RepID=A0A7G7GB58_9BACT|nr:DUF5686 and carboxypeptidase-like regulatory domain-containing protein [Adhaeribacter swui]QNF34392.1 carboxypeptidase-like regulatory domain-containing protein [Adhaeribacter swui]